MPFQFREPINTRTTQPYMVRATDCAILILFLCMFHLVICLGLSVSRTKKRDIFFAYNKVRDHSVHLPTYKGSARTLVVPDIEGGKGRLRTRTVHTEVYGIVW